MILKFEKGFGESLLNTVRQIAMTQIPVVRPIAFSVGYHSNVITIDDQVVEDMVTFISNVCSANYTTQSDADVFQATVKCANVLDLQQLCKDIPINVITGNKEILHSLSEVPVNVIFRKCSGSMGVEENTQFLESKHFNVTNLTVINSRHSNVASFSISKKRCEDGMEAFDVSIESMYGISEAQIFNTAMQILNDKVANVLKSGNL